MYPIEKYDFKNFKKVNEDGSKSSVVVALTTYGGRIVKGVAKCAEGDTFSLDVGKKLAAARCDLKVCAKRRERAFKKYAEAEKALIELQNYVRKMGNHFSDASHEYSESKLRLTEIESGLM